MNNTTIIRPPVNRIITRPALDRVIKRTGRT